jgi:hypothetical protein
MHCTKHYYTRFNILFYEKEKYREYRTLIRNIKNNAQNLGEDGKQWINHLINDKKSEAGINLFK